MAAWRQPPKVSLDTSPSPHTTQPTTPTLPPLIKRRRSSSSSDDSSRSLPLRQTSVANHRHLGARQDYHHSKGWRMETSSTYQPHQSHHPPSSGSIRTRASLKTTLSLFLGREDIMANISSLSGNSPPSMAYQSRKRNLGASGVSSCCAITTKV
ncbi:hypothetical protein IG631_19327 [Alternaria alternata]|nr:hypothetical protein IG631_19327 [Alternaria alternata]